MRDTETLELIRDEATRLAGLADVESMEALLLHDSGLDRFVLPLTTAGAPLRRELDRARLERAIGVIDRPETERWSHCSGASLASQFDAVVHLGTTQALHPLDHEGAAEHTAEPETYPSGV
jgi:erythromycin esterase-like protein